MQTTRHLATTAAMAGILCATSSTVYAEDIRIEILDRDGAPVPEVAVSARAVDGAAAEASASQSIAGYDDSQAAPMMNQAGLAFSPHILIVETGTPVEFPNEDDVRHHVYSFSPAKQFNLTIDSSSIHSEPIVFDIPGLVTLGCNIHDDMLAYVLVVDTPQFAKTDSSGIASLPALEPGRYEITIWTPRLAKGKLPEPWTVDLLPGETLEIAHRFDAKLYPAHEHSETSLHWSHY